MTFEYLQTIRCEDSIDISNIGNCCLQTFSDFGETKVLIIRTCQGVVQAITYGPVNADVDELPDKSFYSYERFEYNEKKIVGIINKFLQDKSVTQAMEVDYDTAKSIIKDYVQCVEQQFIG